MVSGQIFRRVVLISAAALMLMGLGVAHAQTTFPNKPLRILVPFTAGGAGDTAVRKLAQPLSEALGVSVVVDNKPGADGLIAVQELMRSPADGHTIMFGTPSALLFVPLTHTKPPYETLRDFEPVSHFTSFTFFLLVHESVPVKTVQELIAYARNNPGKLTSGTGDSTSQVAMAQLASTTKVDIVNATYKGSAAALTDFISGRIQLTIGGVELIAKAQGKAKALAVLLPKRSDKMPDVPTFAEAGLPEINTRAWSGFFAPAKTPKPALERLSKAMDKTFKQPDLQAFFNMTGGVLEASTPDEMRAILVEQIPVWRDAIKFANIPVQ